MLGSLALTAVVGYVALLVWLFAALAFPETCAPPRPCFRPEFPDGTRVDIVSYASEHARPLPGSAARLFWIEQDVRLYNAMNASVSLPIPPSVRTANASLWAHFLVFPPKASRIVSQAGDEGGFTSSSSAGDITAQQAVPYDSFRIPWERPLLHVSTPVVGHVLPYAPLDFLVPSFAQPAGVQSVHAPSATLAGEPALPPAHRQGEAVGSGEASQASAVAQTRGSADAALAHAPPPPPPPAAPRVPSPHFLYSGRPLRLRIVTDFHHHPAPELHDGMRLRPTRGEDDDGGNGGWEWRAGGWWSYLPFFYADTFSLLRRHAREMSSDLSKPHPTLKIEWLPRSLIAHRLFALAEQAMEQAGSLAGLGPAEVEDVRELLGEERLSRVLLEQAFGWAHMCFAYLAFSSEVRFWRGRTDTGGLSARTLLVNAGCSLIILLYLWEGEGTNRVLLLSSTVEFGVQAWKVLRLLSARGARGRRLLAASAAAEAAAHSGAPRQRADNAVADAADVREAAREAATESFDALAASVVGAAIAPLGCGLALYTLLTYPHRSWWAWLIDAAAKSVYLFGFVAMTPQLFVNYKLKSVSHLPWRVLCYKAFSTFVDDAFSLLVAMPTAHRLACLRDDVVFFALLYQRRCYPVDLSRSNEYGYAYAPAAEPKSDGPPAAAGADVQRSAS